MWTKHCKQHDDTCPICVKPFLLSSLETLGLGEKKNSQERFKVICQCSSWQTRVQSMCTFSNMKKKTELWSCVTQCCFHWRFNSLNSGAIGRALIHFTELGSSSAPFHGRRCGKHGTFSLLEINWWVIAPSEHMHTYLYLLPSELPIQLQQELNRLVCCFALLFLKAKLDKRLLGNRGCTSLLRNEQVQMSLRGFSRTCVFPPFCKMSCVKGSVVNNIVG